MLHDVLLSLSFLKADNSSFCLIFIIFRQPVNLDSCCIWAAPSSRFTSDTLFVWRRASCGSLWPERSSFESSPQLPFNLFFFLSSRLATRLQIQPPEVSSVISLTPTIWDAKCRKQIQYFSFFGFKFPAVLCTLPTTLISAFVPEFSSLRQIGPSIHYQRRWLDKNSAAICLQRISCLEVSAAQVSAHALTHVCCVHTLSKLSRAPPV